MDDTDNATSANVKPFYDALAARGMRTTKTVWALPTEPSDPFWGMSLQDPAYAEWIGELRGRGFEIAWHGARSGGTGREEHDYALRVFRSAVGTWPLTYANHAGNPECIYWGAKRFDCAPLRALYWLGARRSRVFSGDERASSYYWGDFCRERVRYVRGFTFPDIVTTNADPYMPYVDERRPDVRAWFSGTDAPNADAFIALCTPREVERLAASGGACILYTHVASGFVRDGALDARVGKALDTLVSHGGWFAPVAEILAHLEAARGLRRLTSSERVRLEATWFMKRIARKVTAR